MHANGNSNQRKNFIKINESFSCLNCGKPNNEADKTCRNHCKYCLWSLHVDALIPGDREETCHGKMYPLKVEPDSKKGYMITHKCEKCGKTTRNKAASDDNFDLMISLSNF